MPTRTIACLILGTILALLAVPGCEGSLSFRYAVGFSDADAPPPEMPDGWTLPWTGSLAGRTSAGGVEHARIVASGPQLCVTWMGRGPHPALWDAWVNCSRDAGRTWSGPKRLDTDAPGAAESWDPEVACDGPLVYAVWSDHRTGMGDIYFNHSEDGGFTWQTTDTAINTDWPGTNSSFNAAIACAGDRVYVLWLDNRTGTYETWFNCSPDRGATWLPADVRIPHTPSGTYESRGARITCSGDAVCVAWPDGRNGEADIYATCSADGGLTWLAADVRLDTDGAGAAASYNLALVRQGDTVHTAWNDRRTTPYGIHYSRSVDGGATWLASDIRLDGSGAGYATPCLASDGTVVHVVWPQFNIVDGTSVILYVRSLDTGATWTAPAPLAHERWVGEYVRVAAAADAVGVVWSDTRTGSPGIYSLRSMDGGTSWLWPETRLDQFLPGQSPAYPELTVRDGETHIIWIGNGVLYTRGERLP